MSQETLAHLSRADAVLGGLIRAVGPCKLAAPEDCHPFQVLALGVRAGFRAAYGPGRMPHPRALAAWGERWKPFRTTAAWYLWRALELKRAGTLPSPAERIRLPRVKRLRRAARRGAAGPERGKPRRRAAVRARKLPARRASPAGARTPRSAPRRPLREASQTGEPRRGT